MRVNSPMPLSNKSNVTLTFTYVNFGYVHWNAPNWSEISARWGTADGGMARDALLTDLHGGPYTFVVPQAFLRDDEAAVMASLCEDHSACVFIHPFMATSSFAVCQEPLPGDCVRHHKVEGMRRFNNFLGVLSDTAPAAVSALDTYHTLGVRTVVLIAERGSLERGLPFFAEEALATTRDFAKQLSLRVLMGAVLDFCDEPLKGNCPKNTDGSVQTSQTQVLPDGHSPVTFAANLSALNPDAIVCLTSAGGGSQAAFAGLLEGFRRVDWTPKMLSWHGGGDLHLPLFLRDPSDLTYTLTSQAWDFRLTGPSYRTRRSASSFELLPSTESCDGPEEFAKAFNRRFGHLYPGQGGGGSGGGGGGGDGDGKGGGSGRGWDFAAPNSVVPVLGYHALSIGQKLVETALTADVPSLVLASMRLSVPSVFHHMQFDPFGRTSRVNEVLLQYVPAASTTARPNPNPQPQPKPKPKPEPKPNPPHSVQLVAPYGIGVPPVYPLPTFSERVFSPRLYADPVEKVVAAFTGASLAACLGMLLALLGHARHAAVRAATPSFCALTVLGAMLMLLSNFVATLVATDAHCAAQVWLLSVGFTLLFSALFIKVRAHTHAHRAQRSAAHHVARLIVLVC